MTAVLTFALAYCATSILGAVAWASLAIGKRRDQRIRAERERLRRDWRPWRLEMKESGNG